MQFKIRHRETPLIEIAPLIDVVFLLLLFFMVTTQFSVAPGLQINLPEIKPGAPVTVSAKVEVGLTAAGDIYVAGKLTPADQLKRALAAEAPDRDTTVIVLRADETVAHGRVVALMDDLRKLGLNKLVIAARWREEAP